MNEPAASPDRAAYEGFCLGLRIMYLLYAPDTPGTEAERPWELAKEISAGQLSISNPGDLAARYPHMKDFVFDRANEVIARERDIATAVLRGMQEAL